MYRKSAFFHPWTWKYAALKMPENHCSEEEEKGPPKNFVDRERKRNRERWIIDRCRRMKKKRGAALSSARFRTQKKG